MPDSKTGRHFKSDKRYCELVRNKYRFSIIYTPHSKVYHSLQQAIKDLKRKRPDQYQIIFEKNTWDDFEKGHHKLVDRDPRSHYTDGYGKRRMPN